MPSSSPPTASTPGCTSSSSPTSRRPTRRGWRRPGDGPEHRRAAMTVAELPVRLEDLRLRHLPDRRLGVWDVTLVEEGDAPGIIGAVTEPDALDDLRALAGEAGVRAEVELLPAAGGKLQATAHRSLAHLRAEPRHSAELVSQMSL